MLFSQENTNDFDEGYEGEENVLRRLLRSLKLQYV